MRKIVIVSLALVLLAACALFPKTIQTAITQTQEANPTSTFTPILPTETGTPSITQTPKVPVILYSDDFSDPNSGWSTGNSQGIKRIYSKGQYILSQTWGWLYEYSNHNFSDAVLTVDVTQMSGDADQSGSIINWRVNDNGYYSLRIIGNSSYVIEKIIFNNSQTDWQVWQDKQINPAINKEPQINHISVAMNGVLSTIYINNKYVIEIQDSASGFFAGDICLGAFTSGTSEVEIAYDNLIVYELDSWTPPR